MRRSSLYIVSICSICGKVQWTLESSTDAPSNCLCRIRSQRDVDPRLWFDSLSRKSVNSITGSYFSILVLLFLKVTLSDWMQVDNKKKDISNVDVLRVSGDN